MLELFRSNSHRLVNAAPDLAHTDACAERLFGRAHYQRDAGAGPKTLAMVPDAPRREQSPRPPGSGAPRPQTAPDCFVGDRLPTVSMTRTVPLKVLHQPLPRDNGRFHRAHCADH